MWELDYKESWVLKSCCIELWYWRPLRVPWTPRRSNHSILKEISPGYSLEGLILKLKLQYFGHLMRRVDSLEKTLMLGGTGGRKRRGRQRMRWLMASPAQWTWVWVNSRSWWWTGRPGMLWFMGHEESDMTEQLNWTGSDSTRNARLDEAQAGIKIAGRNINNLRYADDTTLMAEREEEPKSL